MDWLQVSLETTESERIEECLLEAGAVAVMMADAADQPLLEPGPGETPIWDKVVVTGLFPGNQDPNPILHALQKELKLAISPDCKIELIEDRDWVREWLDHYEPLRVGRNLWICPHHREVNTEDAVVVKLDPGLAFGTGTHPTTALCLEWLDQATIKDKTVIDYGCGSGILAVAAALLGASRVMAVDIDPQALTATLENARLNKVSEIITVGQPETVKGEKAHVVMANILAGPLSILAPDLTELLDVNGNIVLAGLLASQMNDVKAAYSNSIQWQQPTSREGWTRLNGLLQSIQNSPL